MQQIILFFKGLVIGIANVIPGVSGGTMAFLLGVYDKLTDAIGNFLQKSENRKSFIMFLLILGFGGFVGIVLFAKLFTFLLKTEIYEQYTYFVFIGLILGSVPFIMKMHEDLKFSIKRGSIFAIAVVLILLTLLLGDSNQANVSFTSSGEIFGIFKTVDLSFSYMIWLTFSGFLAAGSMILPGFSGSALLVSLGEYNHILQFVDERMLLPVALVALGAIPGVIFFAKIINIFLKKFPSETYYFILGLITASILQIINEISDTISFEIMHILISIVAFLSGIIISYFLSKIHKSN